MAWQAIAQKGAQQTQALMRNRKFWIIVIVIILLIVANRYWQKWRVKADSRLGRQYGDWQEGTITEGRKSELEQYAQDVYDALAIWLPIDIGDVLAKVAYLNDNELEYVARYYEEYVSDDNQTLYEDVDEEWLGATSVDEDLLTSLDRLGLK